MQRFIGQWELQVQLCRLPILILILIRETTSLAMPTMIPLMGVGQIVGHEDAIGVDTTRHHQLPLAGHKFAGMEAV